MRTAEELSEQLAVLFHEGGWSHHRLAKESGLSPSTVLGIVGGTTGIPRAGTLKALMRAFGEPPGPWLEARGRAVRADGEKALGVPVRDLSDHDALRFEVHPAIELDRHGQPVLPPYVPRPGFDDELGAEVRAARERSRLVLVVGNSSTGKTRACWEAIRAELPHWQVWHPLTPSRPAALLEAHREKRIKPRTVIWLNEIQHFIMAGPEGERVAAILQDLMSSWQPSYPVLMIGTVWPEHWRVLTAEGDQVPDDDPHRAARSLLHQSATVIAPDRFTPEQVEQCAQAQDTRLALAARSSGYGQITQFLAGSPDLLRRYRMATRDRRALVWAAMDLRRLGHAEDLPEELLEQVACRYIDDRDWDLHARGDWPVEALAELCAPHRGLSGPLTRRYPKPGERMAARLVYRLADFLDQHGRAERRSLCPPSEFWQAVAAACQAPDNLVRLASAARQRGRYLQAFVLYRKAAGLGSISALVALATMRLAVGDARGAEEPACRAASAGDTRGLRRLIASALFTADSPEVDRLVTMAAEVVGAEFGAEMAALRDMHVAYLERRSARAATLNPAEVEDLLAEAEQQVLRGTVGAAYDLYERASLAGDPAALWQVAALRNWVGDRDGALRMIADTTSVAALNGQASPGFRVIERAKGRWERQPHAIVWDADDPVHSEGFEHAEEIAALKELVHGALMDDRVAEAERYALWGIELGSADVLMEFVWLREMMREPGPNVIRMLLIAAAAGSARALRKLDYPGDLTDPAQQREAALGSGDPLMMRALAEFRMRRGDVDDARMLASAAAIQGDADSLALLTRIAYAAGDPTEAECLARQSARDGYVHAFRELAWLHERANEFKQARALYREAADAGDESGIWSLARMLKDTGDPRSAADLRCFGLTPEGLPQAPWNPDDISAQTQSSKEPI